MQLATGRGYMQEASSWGLTEGNLTVDVQEIKQTTAKPHGAAVRHPIVTTEWHYGTQLLHAGKHSGTHAFKEHPLFAFRLHGGILASIVYHQGGLRHPI